MPRRGGGKSTGNLVIAPGRLQSLNQANRLTQRHMQDGAYMVEKDLERQRAPSTMMDIDKEIESPTQGDSYVQTPDNDVENIKNDEANDLSQSFIPALGALGKRKRSNRLTSRVVNALQVNLAVIPKPTDPREENINDE